MSGPDRRDKAAFGRELGIPPSDPAAGAVSRLILKETDMTKASADGIYTMTDEHGIVHRFKIAKGDPIPDGAEFVAGGETPSEQESAPAKPAKGAAGPSETTAAAGPSEPVVGTIPPGQPS